MNQILVELVIRSVVIAAICLVVRFALIKASAQSRARVLRFGLVALFALPIIMAILPKLPVVIARYEEPVTQAMTLPTTHVASIPQAEFPLAWVVLTLAAVGTLRVAIGLVRFHTLQSKMEPAAEQVAVRVKGISSLVKAILRSPEGQPPMTWGLVEPKIALPYDAEEWADSKFKSVVLHEDAHIRRRDWAITTGYRIATCLYWFNPLVWAMRALYEVDSERAADDAVLATGIEPTEYAERLIEVARQVRTGKQQLPVVAMARTARLKGRLKSILDNASPRTPLRGWTNVSVLSVLVVAGVAAGLVGPEIQRIPRFIQPELALNTPNWNDKDFDSEIPDTPVAKPADFEIEDSTSNINFVSDAEEPSSPSQSHPVSHQTLTIESKSASAETTRIAAEKDRQKAQKDAIQASVTKGLMDAKKALDETNFDGDVDISKDLEDAKKEVDRSLKEAQKEIDKAFGKGNKSAGQASLNFAKDISKMAIDFAGNFASKTKAKFKGSSGKPQIQITTGDKVVQVNSDGNTQVVSGGNSDDGDK